MRLLGTTLAVAALAVAGCSSDDSEERSEKRGVTTAATTTTTTAPAADALTVAQYRARVNRLCREDKRFEQDLSAFETEEDVLPFLNRTLEYSRKREPLYDGLTPPPALSALHYQSRRVSESLERMLSQIIDAIEDGANPLQTFSEAQTRLVVLVGRGNTLARKLGVRDCVVPIPAPGGPEPQPS